MDKKWLEEESMRISTVCGVCQSKDINYLGKDRCFCNVCLAEQDTMDIISESLYENNRNKVYATGNKWAIENFNATH